MDTESTVAHRGQLWATVLSASVFLLPVVVGKVVELIYKSINPDDVDVSQGLAYLRPLLIISFSVFALVLILAVVTNIRLGSRQGKAASRLPWIVLGTQVVLAIVYIIASALLNNVIS